MTWPTIQIGDLASNGGAIIQTGPFGTQLRASDYVQHGTPVINVRNIGFGDLRKDKLEYVADATTNRLAQHLLQQDDIVFGRKGAVDRHLFVSEEHAGWMQGSDCIRLRLSSQLLVPRFASYAFLRESHKKWMLGQSGNKATMASLNQDIIKRIEIPIPPQNLQQRIVSILSGYDDSIANNNRRIALLEDIALILYTEWFRKMRFPGYEHAALSDGLPNGWRRSPFRDALILQRGFDLPVQHREEGCIPVCGSTGIVGFHSKAKALGPGLVTGRSGSLGEVHYVPTDFWPLNTTLWVKEFKCVSPLFALFLMRSMNLKQYNGGASVPSLDRKAVHRVEILIPPASLITLFDDYVTPLFVQIRNLQLQNDKLGAARDILLPRLMNGEIVV